MDPNQLAQMLASGDREQVIAAQKQLQALGYSIKPDGKLGAETSRAVAEYRQAFEGQAAASRASAENESRTRAAEAEARAAEARAREAENDPTNRLTKMATEVAPVAAGIGVGTGVGHYVFGNKDADAALGDKVKRLANTRGINPTIKQDELAKLLRGRNRADAGQFAAPALLFGAGRFTQDVLAPKFSDKGTQDIVNSIGVGENSAASALGLHQMVSTLRSLKEGRGIDPVDVAKIRSGALPPDAPPVPPPPPAAPPLPPPAGEPMRHADRLKQAAIATGGKAGAKKADNVAAIKKNLSADNLPAVAEALKLPADAGRNAVLQRLREMSKTGGKLALPLAAGALAYDAASQPSEAADGSVSEPSMAGKAAAAGTAAGTTYGVQRLLSALGRSGTMAGPMMAPSAASDMTDIPQPELNDIRNKLARNLPSWMQGGAVGEAADMSQVPEPNPLRGNPEPGNQYYPLSGGPSMQPEEPQTAEADPLETLAAAGEQDPELAALLKELIMARGVGGQQSSGAGSMASLLRNIRR